MTTRLASFSLLFALAIGMPLAAGAEDEDEDSVVLPDGLSTEAWASVRAVREAEQHAAVAIDLGYQARNRGQALTATFDHQGATMTADGGDWTWGLELTRWGFEGALQEVHGAREFSAAGARVTYRWGSGLSEWWINESRGFEHGFTVHERPDAAIGSTGSPLRFALDVRGDLRAQVSSDRRSVRFVDDSTESARLQYAGLVAFDADGTLLDAWIEACGDGLDLFVRESAARYPLTIDPVVQQEAYIKASNTDAGDFFGSSIAISGDIMVVGSHGEDSSATGVNGDQASNNVANSGAVYVFVRTGGTWAQEAYLKASNSGRGDGFGVAVAISGDTLVVGSFAEDSVATGVNGNQADNSAQNSGAAYVFVRSGGAWAQEAYLKSSNTDAGDFFGFAVAISGDTIVVGAREEDSSATGINGNQADNGAARSGAAYVFVRSGGTWMQEAYIKASNTDSQDGFGESTAISGDTLVVGARWEGSNATGVNGNGADNSANWSGAAYVFVRSAGVWGQEAYIKASNTDNGDLFATSVAISGDTLLVGALFEESDATGVNGNQTNNWAHNAGAAYVFARSGGVWVQDAYLKASNTDSYDRFGRSVSISGNTLIVGALLEDSNGTGLGGNQANNSAESSGAVYVFNRSGGSWTQEAYVKASNTNTWDIFGSSVASSGNTLIVASLYESSNATGVDGDQASNSAIDAGAVYVFDLGLLLGMPYCAPNANSTGSVGVLSALGSAIAMDNDVLLTASSLPSNSFGVFLTSRTQGFVTNPGGSNGNLCLGGAIGRYGAQGQIQNSGTAGEISLVLDLTSTPTPTSFVPVQAGETWNFQAWHRDAAGGVATSNFTAAVSIAFQ